MTEPLIVQIVQLDPDLPIPGYAHEGDAGMDLYAAEDVWLPVGGRSLIPTGIALGIPDGYVGLVHPRSGLATRQGVTVLNAPGVIDSGYRGQVMVNLINHGPATVYLSRGDRVAQLLVQRVEQVRFYLTDRMRETVRGTGGHGSTGTA